MKKIICTIALMLTVATVAHAEQRVNGYFKANGTYVQPYTRSTPDNSYNNNYNVQPNINPYNGQYGTNQPTDNDRTPQYNKQHNPYDLNTPLPQHRQPNQSIYR